MSWVYLSVPSKGETQALGTDSRLTGSEMKLQILVSKTQDFPKLK